MTTSTPTTDANAGCLIDAEEVVPADFARELERELAKEREKVRTLREACERICEEWGRNHDVPFLAGSNMEKHATAALAATEDAQ